MLMYLHAFIIQIDEGFLKGLGGYGGWDGGGGARNLRNHIALYCIVYCHVTECSVLYVAYLRHSDLTLY